MSDGTDGAPRGRLRVPAALVAAFVGSAGAVSIWYGGCHHETTDPPVDAGRLESATDASLDDAASTDAETTGDAAREDAAPPPDSPDH